MEQGRLFLAIVLSIVVFLIWSIFLSDFFSPQPPPPKQTQEGQTARETATKEEPYIKEKDSAVAETAPLAQIAANAGQDGGIVCEKVSEAKGANGYNAATGEYEDLIKAGVIDPTKVTRTALQNASSVATLMLTSDALVAEKPKADNGAAGHGGSHDMY